MVHQDLALVGTLTVAENLLLGQPPLRSAVPLLLSARREREFCERALRAVGLPAGLAGRALARLTLGEQTLVAIARVLARGASLIVCDEATSALSPRESQWLIATLRERRLGGAAVLMVSHKLTEVLEAADRCLVLVDGTIRADVAAGHTDLAALTELMAPVPGGTAGQPAADRPPAARAPVTAGPAATGGPALALREARTERAGPFTLEVRPGEIVGITGLVGSGLYDLAMLASGQVPPVSGTVTLAPGGRAGLLPPDRAAQASFVGESVAWNLTIGALDRWRRAGLLNLGLLNLAGEAREARQVIADLGVRPASPTARLAALSGGNQQKVMLGRMLLRSATCLVLCEPTRGVDIRARREIYRLIAAMAGGAIAVLIVSSDTEDLLALADRVGVVTDGACTGTWPADQLSTSQIASLV